MANSVPESALIEAAALQEAASVLPAGDPGRRALEQQAASLRSRGVKFLAADEDETEEQWARRVVKEAMRFPLAGTTRWVGVVVEIMHGVGGRRIKGLFGGTVTNFAFDESRGAIEQLSLIFNVDSDSVFSAVEAKLDLLAKHISDGSRVSAYMSDANEITFVISALTGMSRDRVEVMSVLTRARRQQEEAAVGEAEIYLPRQGRDKYVGHRFYRALVSGDEAPLTPDDTLLFLFSYELDVPDMLYGVFRLLIGAMIQSAVHVIYGNTALASLPFMRKIIIGDLPVEYPISITIAVPILRDLADQNELEIPIGGVFDIYVGRPVGIGFDRDLIRSIQEDYDRGQDESVDDVMEAAFEDVMSAIDSAKRQGYQVSDLTLVEDPTWFHEWIAAGHAIPYDEFVIGVNVDAIRDPFKKLEKKWAEYEENYGAPYPTMFKDREVEALRAVLKEKGVKPWKYSRRMNPPRRGR